MIGLTDAFAWKPRNQGSEIAVDSAAVVVGEEIVGFRLKIGQEFSIVERSVPALATFPLLQESTLSTTSAYDFPPLENLQMRP
jgi:hypothetical protein